MNDPEFQLSAFRQLAAANRAPEAIAAFDQLPDEWRAQPGLRSDAARLAMEAARPERAIELVTGLIADYPASPELRLMRATAWRMAGRTDRAVSELRAAIAMRDSFGAAWRLLAEVRPDDIDADDLALIERHLAGDIADQDALGLHFALSWVHECRGDDDIVVAHVAAGNKIAAGRTRAAGPVGESIARRSTFVISRELLSERRKDGHNSNAPIFIIGLPRSGSTLVEQILASHRDVEGTIELPILPQLLREMALREGLRGSNVVDHVAALPTPTLRALGDEYLRRAGGYRRTASPRFTDKLPGNWAHTLMIRLIFPNATIVDTRRHPMATGWSIYRHHFPGGPAFASSQEAIAERTRAYLAMMEHVDDIDKGAIHHVIHDRLVEDVEGEVRRLLDHCRLEFDPACVEFHQTDRPVSTASSEQVRRPITRDGIERWRRYQPWLKPMEAAMGDALIRWKP